MPLSKAVTSSGEISSPALYQAFSKSMSERLTSPSAMRAVSSATSSGQRFSRLFSRFR